jgi:heterodisulfide reductase subunit B
MEIFIVDFPKLAYWSVQCPMRHPRETARRYGLTLILINNSQICGVETLGFWIMTSCSKCVKLEAAYICETLASVYQITRCHVIE